MLLSWPVRSSRLRDVQEYLFSSKQLQVIVLKERSLS